MADLDGWLQDNWDAVVADPNRGVTYASLSKSDDAELAAWARSRAAQSGKSVKPESARTDVPKETRSEK